MHRWAARYVAGQHTQVLPRLDEAVILRQDIPDDGLLDWFRAGHAALVQTLSAACRAGLLDVPARRGLAAGVLGPAAGPRDHHAPG